MSGERDTPPPYTPATDTEPTGKRGRVPTIVAGVVALAVAVLIGYGIGAASTSGQVDTLEAELAASAEQVSALEAERDELQVTLRSEDRRREMDEAEAARLEQARALADEEAQREAAELGAMHAAEEQRKADEARRLQEAAAAASAAEAEKRTVIRGDGIYAVGPDVEPGTWRSTGGRGCYYAVLNDVTGSLDAIDDNNNVDGPSIVRLASGKFFETKRCGEWRLS